MLGLKNIGGFPRSFNVKVIRTSGKMWENTPTWTFKSWSEEFWCPIFLWFQPISKTWVTNDHFSKDCDQGHLMQGSWPLKRRQGLELISRFCPEQPTNISSCRLWLQPLPLHQTHLPPLPMLLQVNVDPKRVAVDHKNICRLAHRHWTSGLCYCIKQIEHFRWDYPIEWVKIGVELDHQPPVLSLLHWKHHLD